MRSVLWLGMCWKCVCSRCFAPDPTVWGSSRRSSRPRSQLGRGHPSPGPTPLGSSTLAPPFCSSLPPSTQSLATPLTNLLIILLTLRRSVVLYYCNWMTSLWCCALSWSLWNDGPRHKSLNEQHAIVLYFSLYYRVLFLVFFYFYLFLQCFDTVGRQEEHPVCKNWVMWCWCGYLNICRERSADCLHMTQLMPLHSETPSSLASRLLLPFWYRLTQVVLEKRPLNGCSSSSSYMVLLYF